MNRRYIEYISFYCIVIIFCFTITVYSRANLEQNGISSNIGVLFPSQRERSWVQLKNSFKNIGDMDNISMKFFYSDMDIILQEEQLNDALLQNIKVIVMIPVDDIHIGRILNKSRYNPLKIVAVKSLPLNTNNVEYFVGYNYISIGTILAKNIKAFDNYENILFISDESDIAEQMLEGMKKGNVLVEPYVIQQKIKSNQIQKILFPYIESNVIIVSNVAYILDIVDIYFEKKLKNNVFFAGLGSSDRTYTRFQEKKQIISVIEDSNEIAENSVEVATAILSNKKFSYKELLYNGRKQVKAIYLEPKIVTDKNYKDILTHEKQ